MKTKKKMKTFDTVKVFRNIKEKIAKETEGVSFEQFNEYVQSKQFEPDN